MRIAYLSLSYVPSRQANSIQIMRMCEAFSTVGHEVTLIAREGNAADSDDTRLYGLQSSFSIVKIRATAREPVHALKTAAVLRRRRPELIYGRDLLSMLAAGGGVPLVFEAHLPPSPSYRLLQRWLFRRRNFARLVVISDALRREYLRLHPRLSSRQMLVARSSTEAPRDPPDADVLANVRRRKDRLNVGYIGHLYAGKGMEILAELSVRLPKVEFHVIGGTERDIEQWRERTAAAGNLTLHGFVPPGLTDSYLQAMDVLLAPYQDRVTIGGKGNISRWMSPIKIFEYMAAKKPIVASDLPVLREFLTDGQDALLVPAGDPRAWADAVRRLTAPELREALAARAFAAFESRYTCTARARAVLSGLP